ncbi:hypothetical protein E2562_007446 [Oryza meyeriana var. granulata]|uniref:Uncharacterized protein n=1 Tax=Oryza meyeriana var. granulata TaxID=110450 RepID=A0A6G1CZR7_9ORYZ|nr:hypothetical protein E2562_007446 [Oryza meyeriana var. granulata]
MAMRALVSKLRIPAAASRRALPPLRSFSTASQDKLSSTTARATSIEGSPLPDHSARLDYYNAVLDYYDRVFPERMLASDKRFERNMTWFSIIGNFIAFNTTAYLADRSRSRQRD